MRKLVTAFCLVLSCCLVSPVFADETNAAATAPLVSVNINTASADEIAEVMQGLVLPRLRQ